MPPAAPTDPGKIMASPADQRRILAELLHIIRLPLRILLTGAALVGVLGAALALGLPGPEALFAAFAAPGAAGLPALIGVMIFLIGLGFAGFLWWLAARSFALVANPAIGPERLAGLRDLPLALPEGTVRALLALIVGVIGLPLLLFSKTLGLSDAIAGYVNGIVTGVFGFYFGTRSTGADAQIARRATEQLAERERTTGALAAEAEALRQKAEGAARDAALPARIAATKGSLARHIEVAGLVLDEFGPLLPKGLIPEGAATALSHARSAAAALDGLQSGPEAEGKLKTATDALAGLIGAQPLAPLLRGAASLLPAGTALGPIGAVATVIGLGWQLGAAEYQRWRARVLAAPFAPQLFDAGLITPSSAELRMEACPIFARAFRDVKTRPGFFADLLALISHDDAEAKLWVEYGADAARFPGGQAELEAGLQEFRAALLADLSARDATPEKIAAALAPLAPSPGALPSVAQVNNLVDAAGKAGADQPEARAAFEALVMLTGHLRDRKLDPVKLMAEVTP
ncbi:MAG: hypothetical protein INF76_02450 [Roseomonas sp.]|nr:hypothetical protein [Roseomonas sp.]